MIYDGREISTEEAILLHSGACISQYVLIAYAVAYAYLQSLGKVKEDH